jgi:hypothetical protein
VTHPLLPEEEARLKAERYVRDALEADRDHLRLTIDALDAELARIGERFKEARKALFDQQQADRNALAERCVGKGVAEIDRLFQQQADVHYRQAAEAYQAQASAYEPIARIAAQIEPEVRKQPGHDRDEEGRGR